MAQASDDAPLVALNRWTAELVDPEQERAFRLVDIPEQLRNSLLAVVAVAIVAVASLGHVLTAAGPSWRLDLAIHVGVLVVLGIELALTQLVRSGPWVIPTVFVSICLLSLCVGAIIATSSLADFVGMPLLVGGILVMYLMSRLTMRLTLVTTAVFTASVFGAWLLAAEPTSAQLGMGAAMLCAIHVIGIGRARDAQIERRTLFVQRRMLLELSTTDPLTHLLNRRAFAERLRACWDVRDSRGFAIVMLDIDHFKMLNDTFGHDRGDDALQMVADVVRGQLDTAAGQVAVRYGGEEFVCLLPGSTAEAAATVAERIRLSIRAAHIDAPGPGGVVTVSCGVAAFTPEHVVPTDVIRAADEEMYRAKRSGRDRVAVAHLVPLAG